MKTFLLLSFFALALSSCNITSGSSVLVGNKRSAIDPASVKIYIRPPARFETVAILNASSKNGFASDQSLTDSAINRMKKEAAKYGANGVLLQSLGYQQLGMFGTTMMNANAYSTANATAWGYGNTAYAYGTGTTNVYGTGTTIMTPIMAKVSSGMAIYVTKE